jgi:hypothetical protein
MTGAWFLVRKVRLGAAAAAQVRLIVWCKACQHQVEPDPAEMATRYCADTSILDWRVTVGMRQPCRFLAEPHTASSTAGALPLKLRNALGDGLDQ